MTRIGRNPCRFVHYVILVLWLCAGRDWCPRAKPTKTEQFKPDGNLLRSQRKS